MKNINFICKTFHQKYHLRLTVLLIVSLILDFRISQILVYSYLYFLPSLSNILALSTSSLLFLSFSLYCSLSMILRSLAALLAWATSCLFISSCCFKAINSCSLVFIDLPIMLSFSAISLFNFEIKKLS